MKSFILIQAEEPGDILIPSLDRIGDVLIALLGGDNVCDAGTLIEDVEGRGKVRISFKRLNPSVGKHRRRTT